MYEILSTRQYNYVVYFRGGSKINPRFTAAFTGIIILIGHNEGTYMFINLSHSQKQSQFDLYNSTHLYSLRTSVLMISGCIKLLIFISICHIFMIIFFILCNYVFFGIVNANLISLKFMRFYNLIRELMLQRGSHVMLN